MWFVNYASNVSLEIHFFAYFITLIVYVATILTLDCHRDAEKAEKRGNLFLIPDLNPDFAQFVLWNNNL